MKPETSFYKNGFRRKDGTSGTRNECKPCSNDVHEKYVEKNRTEINEYNKNLYRGMGLAGHQRMRDYSLKKKLRDNSRNI